LQWFRGSIAGWRPARGRTREPRACVTPCGTRGWRLHYRTRPCGIAAKSRAGVSHNASGDHLREADLDGATVSTRCPWTQTLLQRRTRMSRHPNRSFDSAELRMTSAIAVTAIVAMCWGGSALAQPPLQNVVLTNTPA